jgi:hypothetical protein
MKQLTAILKNEKYLKICTVAVLALNPLIELDYLIYDGFLETLGIPRLTTIVHFLLIPFLILWAFYLKDNKKKKTIILTCIYGVLLGMYFVFHVIYANNLYLNNDLYLQARYYFSIANEIIYILTMILPYFLVYQIYVVNLEEKYYKFIAYFLSGSISIPIVLGNLFLFGLSTYTHEENTTTVVNIFSWFLKGTYDIYDPRDMASKFFFEEGNTIGILLFILLPILYYRFSKAEGKKEKLLSGTLIFTQTLAMMMLATKVGTYGMLAIPIAFLVLYLACSFIFKTEQFKKSVAVFTLAMSIFAGAMFQYTPAIVNEKIYRYYDSSILSTKEELGASKELLDAERQADWPRDHPSLVYAFEVWALREGILYPDIMAGANYLGNLPPIYYCDWYSYTFDAVFWLDVVIFGTPPEERLNGRQLQKIFMDYKMAEKEGEPKWLGMGYSTFMHGSFILEQDFLVQYYTLGIIGLILTTLPWVFMVLVGIYLVLRKWKENFTLEIFCYSLAVIGGLGAGYISGHTLDQFTTNLLLAFACAVLFTRLLKKEDKV